MYPSGSSISFEYDPTTVSEESAEELSNETTEIKIEPLDKIDEATTTNTTELPVVDEDEDNLSSTDKDTSETEDTSSEELTELLECNSQKEEAKIEVKEAIQQPSETKNNEYLDGLSYYKPRKTTDAYTYVDNRRGGKRVDKFLIIAILAAILAVAAIIFGYVIEMGKVL